MKNDIVHIKQLLDKYFEGLTSLEEEKMLRKYFSQKDIPDLFEVYRPIFGFFSQEIGEKKVLSALPRKSTKVVFLRWIGIGAAACFLLLFGIKLISYPDRSLPAQSMVYIDGKKYTDLSIIQSETLNTLSNFSELNDDVISSQIDILDSFNE